jgi:hypothetical protein
LAISPGDSRCALSLSRLGVAGAAGLRALRAEVVDERRERVEVHVHAHGRRVDAAAARHHVRFGRDRFKFQSNLV